MGFLRRLFGGSDRASARPGGGPPSIAANSVRRAVLDPRWPVIPPRHEAFRLTAAERNALPFDRSTCPACGVEVSPLPKRRSPCKSCGAPMYIRVINNEHRSLMTEAQAGEFDRVDEKRASKEYDKAEREWYAQLRAIGIQVPRDPVNDGGATLDVVGESHYMDDLGGLMSALRADPDVNEVETVALLRREPNNPHDRDAVRVEIHGKLVGRIGRDDAAEIQPWLRRLEKAGRPAFVLARMGGGRLEEGRIGPIGVTLEDLPPSLFD